MNLNDQPKTSSLDTALKKGYIEMRDINLSIVSEFHIVECEAHKCNERYLEYIKDGE